MFDDPEFRRNRPGRRDRRRSRTGLRTLGTAALTLPLALFGVNASLASPESTSAGSSSHTGSAASGPGAHSGGIDDDALRTRMVRENAEGTKEDPSASANALHVTEQQEGSGAETRGENDEATDAQRVPRPRSQHDNQLQIDGTLDTEPVKPERIEPNSEDDGAIPLARDLAFDENRRGISTTGRVGDGPHGSDGDGSGDYDFYGFEASAGETLTVDVVPDGKLFPTVLLYDADGNLVTGAQDMTEGTGKAHLSYPIDQDGEYYVAVGNQRPADPFDSGSGHGVMTEGPYDLTVALNDSADTDTYMLPLRKGDVIGATVNGAAGRMAIHGPDGELAQASSMDAGLLHPDASPLPGGGNATVEHVAPETGLYSVAISDGVGDYSATVSAQRPPSAAATQPQTVYLDFSGPTIDNSVFGESVVEPGRRDLTPMRDFLPNWDLEKSDERAVIDAATERVEEILKEDIPGSEVRVTNSLERPDLFGKPGVSRVIVGGTVDEAGLIPAFGLSESIDPGNFAREETAIVMLDRMSAPSGQPSSLNAYLTEDSDRVRAVAQALGNTAAHEAGHLLGNWHTDDRDGAANLMDTGDLLQVYAAGPDDVAGTEDDDRVAMGTSRFDPLQGFMGVENSVIRTRAALR